MPHNPAAEADTNNRWKFFRAGGFDQVQITSGADLMSLDRLDQKLWVALACPTRGIEFDTVTLDLIDTDKDGRIRAPELIAACRWAGSLLKNPDDLLKGGSSVPLSAIRDDVADGKLILASAKQILANFGKSSVGEISIHDTTDTAKIFSQTNFNGDGVVPPDAAEDASVKLVITQIVECTGGTVDRGGKFGVNEAIVVNAFDQMAALAAWHAAAQADPSILPLKGDTAAADAVCQTVKLKIDDYFSRCRLAAFDARALAALNRSETEYLTLAAKDLSIETNEVAHFPLARIEAGKPLPLLNNVNPAWAPALRSFYKNAVKPLLGDKDTITEEEWNTILTKLAPFGAWSKSKPNTKFESLGLDRVREILAGASKDAILTLIAKDKSLESEFNSIAMVDRFVRYHRDLGRLAINFVNFKDFYDGDREMAVFQSGTLYLDARSCNLCIRVDDMGKHGAMAGMSKTYLAYCDLLRKATGEKMTVAAAFTDGDSDNLMIGRNGIFYDRKGNDWDATITKIVEHPISIRQAFWLPYKKIAALIQSQIEKFAAAREKAVHEKAAANLEKTAQHAEASAATEPVDPAKAKEQERKDAFDVAKFAGIFAAIGLALGAIGGVIGAMIAGFLKLELWQMPLAIGGLMLIISGPSMLIALLKLRQRNLGPILDANGWAINARAKINIPFGRSLTNVAKLPPGAKRDLKDPYADSGSGKVWLIILSLLFVLFCVWKYAAVKSIGEMLGFTAPRWSYYEAPKEDKKDEKKDAAGVEKPADPTKK